MMFMLEDRRGDLRTIRTIEQMISNRALSIRLTFQKRTSDMHLSNGEISRWSILKKGISEGVDRNLLSRSLT